MSKINWTNITVRLGDLKAWSDNPRQSTKAQAKKLLESFEEFGQVETIAVSPELEVYNGHQRLSALLKVHGKDYQIDARQASRALTEQERKKLTIFLHAGATGSWDWDTLSGWDAAEMIEWGLDDTTLKEWKHDISGLGELLKSEKQEPVDAEPQIDKAEELRVKWGVESGQLWQIGDHRLLCGDCTKREDVERVMAGEKADMVLTDPPYGMSLDVSHSNNVGKKDGWVSKPKNYSKVIGDNEDFTPELIQSIFEYFGDTKEMFIFGADYFAELIPAREKGSWIVWDKRVGIEELKLTFSEFELCWSKTKHLREIARVAWSGLLGTEQEFDHKRHHPTQKPIKLSTWFVDKYSQENGIVVDMYAGAGFVMVACQNLSRKCRAIEISPAYCAVILERMSTAFPELEIKQLSNTE